MRLSARIFGAIVAASFAFSCHSCVLATIMVNTVDHITTNNAVVQVSPGQSFTMDIVIEDDAATSVLGFFDNTTINATIVGSSQGVLFSSSQTGDFYLESDYVFADAPSPPGIFVLPDQQSIFVSGFRSDGIATSLPAGTRLLARLDIQVDATAKPGEKYLLTPSVQLFPGPVFPDSIGSATIQIIPEASSFIGWALIGVTMCGAVWWRRSRASEVAKPDQLGSM